MFLFKSHVVMIWSCIHTTQESYESRRKEEAEARKVEEEKRETQERKRIEEEERMKEEIQKEEDRQAKLKKPDEKPAWQEWPILS